MLNPFYRVIRVHVRWSCWIQYQYIETKILFSWLQAKTWAPESRNKHLYEQPDFQKSWELLSYLMILHSGSIVFLLKLSVKIPPLLPVCIPVSQCKKKRYLGKIEGYEVKTEKNIFFIIIIARILCNLLSQEIVETKSLAGLE